MKTAVQSKTIIFNILTLIVVGLMYFSNVVPQGNVRDLIVAVVAVVNIILRFKTNTAVKGIM